MCENEKSWSSKDRVSHKAVVFSMSQYCFDEKSSMYRFVELYELLMRSSDMIVDDTIQRMVDLLLNTLIAPL